MPFYEYECAHCKFYTELMQKISDPPLKKCPSCGKSTMKKLISAPVFRLKGGGWYETDFKTDKEGKRNLAGGEDAAEGKSGDKAPAAEGQAADSKAADGKAADGKSEAKAADKAPAGDAKPAKPVAKPARRAARAPARRPAAKPKPKASKRRGR